MTDQGNNITQKGEAAPLLRKDGDSMNMWTVETRWGNGNYREREYFTNAALGSLYFTALLKAHDALGKGSLLAVSIGNVNERGGG